MNHQYTSTTLQQPANWGDLTKHFDLMVLDNRGTGLNYPVQCDDYSLWNADKFKISPKNEQEYNATVEAAARAGQSCVEKTGPVIHFMACLLGVWQKPPFMLLAD